MDIQNISNLSRQDLEVIIIKYHSVINEAKEEAKKYKGFLHLSSLASRACMVNSILSTLIVALEETEINANYVIDNLNLVMEILPLQEMEALDCLITD